MKATAFILSVACIGCGLGYLSYKLTSLKEEMKLERSEIHALQLSVESQQASISRFNNSITNADIDKELNALKFSLRGTKIEILNEMHETEASIQTLLRSTINELNLTVVKAEDEIAHQVKHVEKNFEQYARTTQDQFSMENDFMKYQLAGTFTLLASLISMWHMTAHLRKFNQPVIQRKILAILWMTPVYGTTSWLSLVFPQFEGYLAIVKDLYEAYIIYQFLGFLISVLGQGDRDTVVDLLSRRCDHLDPPMRCCGWCRGKYNYDSPRTMASHVLLQCQLFAMQFVFLKPLTAISCLVVQKMGYEALDKMLYERPQFWINIVQNISVFMAFSGLLKFYHAVQEDLVMYNPFPKFLCIKGIVFMTFWQGLVISILASTATEDTNRADSSQDDPDIWGKQAQNFLICLEMLLFSIAHFYCFPTDEWEEGYQPFLGKKTAFGDNIALNDFLADLKLIVRGNKKKKAYGSIKDGIGHGNQEKKVGNGTENIVTIKNSDKQEQNGVTSCNIKYNEGMDNMNDSIYTNNTSQGDADESFDSANLTQAIKQSLTAPNSEMRKAANRILQSSSVLEKELDVQADEQNEIKDFSALSQPMGGVPNDEEESPGETTSLLTHEVNEQSKIEDFSAFSQPMGGITNDEEESRDETTSLLVHETDEQNIIEDFSAFSQPMGSIPNDEEESRDETTSLLSHEQQQDDVTNSSVEYTDGTNDMSDSNVSFVDGCESNQERSK